MRQRVQRLIDSGVMQVVAVTDPLEIGFSRHKLSDPRPRSQDQVPALARLHILVKDHDRTLTLTISVDLWCVVA